MLLKLFKYIISTFKGSEIFFRPLWLFILALQTIIFTYAGDVNLYRENTISDSSDVNVERRRLAKYIYMHDFENKKDADTGKVLLTSADLEENGWPDFWEPVRGVGFPEYLMNSIAIVEDVDNKIAGAYKGQNNRCLRFKFDGSRVGIKTTIPVFIDASLAYEFSLYEKDKNLTSSLIRAGVEWLQIESVDTKILRTDEIPSFYPGQIDWPELPKKMLINDVPANANAARIFIIVENDPELPGADYNGEIWFDNISLKPLPKIKLATPILNKTKSNSVKFLLKVHYSGLFDNIPDLENPELKIGKNYRRTISVVDLYGRKIESGFDVNKKLQLKDDNELIEDIDIAVERYGVYYINVKLYDFDEQLVASSILSCAFLGDSKENIKRTSLNRGNDLALIIEDLPPELLDKENSLTKLVLSSGVTNIKVLPWLEKQEKYKSFVEEIRKLRSLGIKLTAFISPVNNNYLLSTALNEYASEFYDNINGIIKSIGLFFDNWQWGRDDDSSLGAIADINSINPIEDVLSNFSTGVPQVWNVSATNSIPPDLPFKILNMYIPNSVSRYDELALLAKNTPWLFEKYRGSRQGLYPSSRLISLSPKPFDNDLDRRRFDSIKKDIWISIELLALKKDQADPFAELKQLEELLVKAVYAKILSPDLLSLGKLIDDKEGLLKFDSKKSFDGEEDFSLIYRPVFLGIKTFSKLLGNVKYLGNLKLLEPFEAQVFQNLDANDEAIVVLWHNGNVQEMLLDIAEIARGPELIMHDWAGNSSELSRKIPVRRVPIFITGIPMRLILTRMSLNIDKIPPMLSQTRRQTQYIDITNYLPFQAPIRLDLKYAAKAVGEYVLEPGWYVQPQELRTDIPPALAGGSATNKKLRYNVSPDPNSVIQVITPEGEDKSGDKLAMIRLSINTAQPADFVIYRRFRLESDIDVSIIKFKKADDNNFINVQLRIRWTPPKGGQSRSTIRLKPYYLKRGELREYASNSIVVPATLPSEENDPSAAFESFEMRIPKQPLKQTWVGLAEDGGSNYYIADITNMLLDD